MNKQNSLHKCIFLILLFVFNSTLLLANVTEKLERIIYPQELDFKDVQLSDALSLISKTSGITIIADAGIKNLTIDTYFVRGQSLKEILQAIMLANDLTIREVSNILILEKSSGKQEITLTGKIVGYIRNKETNKGLQGAKVSLVKNNEVIKEVESEVGGAYIIEDITAGTYIVKVASEKYGENGDIVDIKSGETSSINIFFNELEEMLVEENKENEQTQAKPLNSMEILKRTIDTETEVELGKLKSKTGEEYLAEKILLKHADPTEVKTVIEALEESVEITAVEKQNIVIVKGTQENIETVKNLIKELDQPVKQVRITAQVLEITDSISQELGIDWSYSSSTDNTTSSFSSDLGVVTGIPSATFTRYLGSTGEVFSATLNLLESTNDAAVNAVPSIVTLNGEEATIEVTEQALVGETSTTDDDGNTTTEPLYKDAGTTLTVTPIIRDGEDEPDTITLEISLEVSSFITSTSSDDDDEDDDGEEQVNQTSTKVRVSDGGVIFIGGLKKKTTSDSQYSVPFFSKIPLIGWLFEYDSYVENTKDLFIQIKAEIVTKNNENTDIDIQGFRDDSAYRVKEGRIFNKNAE